MYPLFEIELYIRILFRLQCTAAAVVPIIRLIKPVKIKKSSIKICSFSGIFIGVPSVEKKLSIRIKKTHFG